MHKADNTIVRSLYRSVVVVTHDEAATAQADRVLRMRDGRLE